MPESSVLHTLLCDRCLVCSVSIIVLAIDACIASAALARGWSAYLASVINYRQEEKLGFLINSRGRQYDLVAMGLTLAVTLLVATGTKLSARINTSKPCSMTHSAL